MKRCSECDFIYEDDQNLCDMDGRELVFDPNLQTFPVNTAAPHRAAKSRARRLLFAVALAVLIGTLLSVGFSGLTREDVPETTQAPPPRVNRALRPAAPVPKSAATSTATPIARPTASPSPPAHAPRLEKTRARPTAGSPFARAMPSFRSPRTLQETSPSKSTKANHKKDSGIGGFLKKTGRLLKRPFKF